MSVFRRTPRSFYKILYISCALYALQPQQAFANSVCATPDNYTYSSDDGRGIGGTGHTRDPDDDGRGLGGTGRSGDDGKGLGGTGIKQNIVDRGIGGTGIKGFVSILGRITGFASICVNGKEVHYSPDMKINVEGKSVPVTELKVGQIVSVTAAPSDKGGFDARSIAVQHAVVGPVETIDIARQKMTVMGRDVHVADKKTLSNIDKGTIVRVSGLPDQSKQSVIIASHIEKTSADSQTYVGKPMPPALTPQVTTVSMQGIPDRNARTGQINMNGLPISLTKNTNIIGGDFDPSKGNQRILVIGDVVNGQQVIARDIVIERYKLPTILQTDDTPSIEQKDKDKEHDRENKKEDDHEDDKREEKREDDDKDNRNRHHEREDDDDRDDHENETEDDDKDVEKPEHEDEPEIEEPEEQDEPDTDEPEIDEPDTDEPDIDEPDVDEPDVDEPDIDEPDVDEPDIDEPDIDEPDIDEPDIEEPEIEEPEIEEPEIEEPEIEEPEIEEPDN